VTDRFELGTINLITARYMSGTGEYDWVEHDEQPSYDFEFESAGCADGCGAGASTLSKDNLSYIIRPVTFTCFTANSKTADANLKALIKVLNAATAYTLRATCHPDYTGAPVLIVRQSGNQAAPDVYTVKRYQRRRVRLDLDRDRKTLEVDLYCTEGGPVVVDGATVFGGNGNPMLGGTFQGV
jgi:hypothetical protein